MAISKTFRILWLRRSPRFARDDKVTILITFTLDNKSACLRVFDKNGEFLRTIGGQGQGPGEMHYPIFVQVIDNKELIIYDPLTRRFLIFTLDGKYLRDISSARIMSPLNPIRFDPQKNLVAFLVLPPPLGGIELKKFDSNLELIAMIYKEEKDDSYLRHEILIEGPSLSCAVSLDGRIVWGDSEKYELQILSPEGKLPKKITRDYKRLKITEKKWTDPQNSNHPEC